MTPDFTQDFTIAFEAAKAHARAAFPEESCGFIVDGAYVPVENVAADPSKHEPDNKDCGCRLCAFKISKADTAKYLPSAQMILHSHPDGPVYPSKRDMQGQFDTAVPWGIIALDKDRIGDPITWGDQLPVKPILGRTFMHGVTDCYSLIRDTFRLGHDELKRMGITDQWPYAPIILKDAARDDAWWNHEDNFYNDLPPSFGWVPISMEEARPGDLFLIKIRTDKFNHAGVMIADDLILHHLPQRFSRREPVGVWARNAGRWLRYTGVYQDA